MVAYSTISLWYYIALWYGRLGNSTISLGTESRVSPKLVNNMSSRVPGPSLGHLFPKLEYWGPFEALAEKCENTIHISKNPLHS